MQCGVLLVAGDGSERDGLCMIERVDGDLRGTGPHLDFLFGQRVEEAVRVGQDPGMERLGQQGRLYTNRRVENERLLRLALNIVHDGRLRACDVKEIGGAGNENIRRGRRRDPRPAGGCPHACRNGEDRVPDSAGTATWTERM